MTMAFESLISPRLPFKTSVGMPCPGPLRAQKLPINHTFDSELAPVSARCRPSGEGNPQVSVA